MNALQVKRGVVCVFMLTLAACGGADPVGRTVPVKGKVTLDGSSVSHGGVAFWPDAAKGNTSKYEGAGSIESDGSYTLTTRGKPGAPPGAYKVTVVVQTKADSTDPLKAVLEVPKKYTTKEQTPLSVEVVESPAAGAYDLKLVK